MASKTSVCGRRWLDRDSLGMRWEEALLGEGSAAAASGVLAINKGREEGEGGEREAEDWPGGQGVRVLECQSCTAPPGLICLIRPVFWIPLYRETEARSRTGRADATAQVAT